jgi:cephalosporin hydroxylase
MSIEDKQFELERQRQIARMGADEDLRKFSRSWQLRAEEYKYVYNFSWLGRPVIQLPQDVFALQELIWAVQPDLIIETGIARGGSLIFSASMLELNASCGGPAQAEVLGIDIEIRPHNRQALEAHPLFRRISMIEGSSISTDVVLAASTKASKHNRVMVFLDSNHTHKHVLAELQAYAPLVSVGSYCVVFDTAIEEQPIDLFSDRPWGPGNSPKTAVHEFLETNESFEIDRSISDKLSITVAPDGYLRRIK